VNLLFDYGRIEEPLKCTTTIPKDFEKELVLHRVLELKSSAVTRTLRICFRIEQEKC